MSENNSGSEDPQNPPVGEPTPKKDEPDTTAIYSKGYNNGIEKGAERAKSELLSKLKEAGAEVDDFDAFLESFKETKKSSSQKESEAEALRQKLKEEQALREQSENQFKSMQRKLQLDTAANNAFSELGKQHEFKIPEQAIKTLFQAEYDIQEESGNLYAVKKGSETPVLADNGDKKALSNVIQDFVTAQELITPKAKGAGGGSSDPATSGAPKLSEFHKLLRSNKQEEAAKLYDRQKELGGWAPEE